MSTAVLEYPAVVLVAFSSPFSRIIFNLLFLGGTPGKPPGSASLRFGYGHFLSGPELTPLLVFPKRRSRILSNQLVEQFNHYVAENVPLPRLGSSI